ncbi:MAG: hypothetical protein EBR82_56560 [Caulobacteraceae bacterium]|nr:hypothetical protein [Caulobacteraceae bacterium]
MARQIDTKIGEVGVSSTIGVDINLTPVNVAIAAMLSDGATLTYNIEHTYNDIWSAHNSDEIVWFPFIENQSANADGYYAFPVAGIRVRVTQHTSGTVTLRVLQAGI